MSRVLLLIALMAVLPLSNGAASGAKDAYLILVNAAKAGKTPVDWQKLRFAYADSPDFDLEALGTATARHEMILAFNSENNATALARAKQIIDMVYVDIDAHWVAAEAYKALGEDTSAASEHDIAAGLIKSVMTGDGLTPGSAFTVITVHEECAVLHALGRSVTRQSLVSQNGHSYDVLDTSSAAGETRSYYFLVDRVLAAEANLLKTSQ